MSRTTQLLCVSVLLGTTLSGCGWFGGDVLLNPKDDYLDARQHRELTLPQDLPELGDTDPFPIPPTPEAQNPSYYPSKPPLPDAIYANDKRDEVRIQRLGDRAWLVIPEPPTTAWPKLKQFLAENGVQITVDDPSTGRLNTQWLQVSEGTFRDVVRTITKDAKQAALLGVGQDRYLIKVEQGLRPLTTEVHLRHENDSISLPLRDDIVALDGVISHVPQAETDLLSEIGAYIAAKVAEQTVSKVALQIGSTQKAELARDSAGIPELRLFLDFERAWATLGQALDNAEVEIINLDRDEATFDVKLTEAAFGGEEEGSGFFCRITFSCGSDADAYNLKIILSGDERDYKVSVVDDQGAQIDPELSQQVLVLLREFAV